MGDLTRRRFLAALGAVAATAAIPFQFARQLVRLSPYGILGRMRAELNEHSEGLNSPDVMRLGVNSFDAYRDALEPIEYFTSPQLLQSGFENLMFKGIPAIRDVSVHPDMIEAVIYG